MKQLTSKSLSFSGTALFSLTSSFSIAFLCFSSSESLWLTESSFSFRVAFSQNKTKILLMLKSQVNTNNKYYVTKIKISIVNLHFGKRKLKTKPIWFGMSVIPSLPIGLYSLISITVAHVKYFLVADTFLETSTRVHQSLSAPGFWNE